jgi:hypothetical protein
VVGVREVMVAENADDTIRWNAGVVGLVPRNHLRDAIGADGRVVVVEVAHREQAYAWVGHLRPDRLRDAVRDGVDLPCVTDEEEAWPARARAVASNIGRA